MPRKADSGLPLLAGPLCSDINLVLSRLTMEWQAVFRRFVPKSAENRPDELRRARLIIAFSLMGAVFGSLFGSFDIVIGHYWGGAIIGVCCTLFGLVPQLLRAGVSTGRAGNHYCLILLAGFFSLCWVEGGMNGHALAWLVIIPLCALLLTSKRGAYMWSTFALISALFIGGAEAFGISPPIRYPMQWHVTLSTMGYTALVAFLFTLGLIFENGRKTAHDQMQRTLRELAKANEHLTRLDAEKSEFLSIAAHDLKSPLTVVMGRAEMLKMPNLSPERRGAAADAILKEAKRMRGLISDLLDLNAIEAGRMKLAKMPVCIAQAVETLCEGHVGQAARKGIAFNLGADPNIFALADEKALLQILDNLLSNAVKFTKPGGQVGLDVWVDDNYTCIKVSDSGPGLSEEDQAKLFGRFTRLSNRPTGGESSHGLGLSIVKRLVDAMNGQIKCESVLGKGTAFTISLPKYVKPTPRETTPIRPAASVLEKTR